MDARAQFLWGDDLLVAPVTREGATTWAVYLPAGVWYDFWTGARHAGPGGITVEAPLERLPLFVRAGAIIPMGPVMQHSGERPLDELTLRDHPEGTIALRRSTRTTAAPRATARGDTRGSASSA